MASLQSVGLFLLSREWFSLSNRPGGHTLGAMQFLVSRATAHERQPMKLRAQVPAPAVDEERVSHGDLVDPQEAERDYPAGCRGPGAARHFAHLTCPFRHLVAADRRDVGVHAQAEEIAKPSSPSPRTRPTWPSCDLSTAKVMKASCGSGRGSAVSTPATRSPAAGPCTSMCPADPRSWNSTSSLTRAFSMSGRIVSFCAASTSRTRESADAYTRRSPSTRLFSFRKRAYADIPGVRIFRSVVTSPSRNVTRSEPVSRTFARSLQSIIPARRRTARASSSIEP